MQRSGDTIYGFPRTHNMKTPAIALAFRNLFDALRKDVTRPDWNM